MNILKFIKILVKKFKYILILPIVTGGIVYFLTRNNPMQYSTESTIFTGITSNSGLEVLETRVDNIATQNEYNNVLSILKSKTLFEETALRLLVQNLMLEKAQKEIISEKSFNELQKSVPQKVKKLIVKGNPEKSYNNLLNYIKQDEKNYVYRLLNYGHQYYSTKAISKLKVERISNSDLIKLTYESEDPGICYNTLKITSEVFIKNYSRLKSNQSSSAVAYFEQRLKEIAEKLKASEDRLLEFNTQNTIINYYEQTEQVTTQQEKIEIRLQEVKMESEASRAVLIKLEHEVDKRFDINLRNNDILNIREQLISCNNAIAKNEINTDSVDLALQNKLLVKRNQLENRLKSRIDSMYVYESKSQGIESQKMLNEWLDAVKNFESYSALYRSMKERQSEFMKQYKRYAPLGATIKRIEREINVYEREYLDVLNQLGLAKQKQQNTTMVSDMKIMDSPQFPINAMPSKKKLYVIIAALFSVVFFILGVFIVELLDQTIKTPAKLKKLTGMDVVGAFCVHNNKKFINTDKITEIAAKYMFEKIRFEDSDIEKPYVIQIFSFWENSGKTFISNTIADQLDKFGYKYRILDLSNAIKKQENLENKDQHNLFLSQYFKANHYSEFLDSTDSQVDFIISILPPIKNGFDNSFLLTKAQLNFVVFDANFTWNSADDFNLEKYNNLITYRSYAILTNANPDNLEEMYGEIPKKRSAFRVYVKNLIKRFT